ncbi:hypothetical protein AB0E73_31965, partial [Streptomyces sp. NPDC031705]
MTATGDGATGGAAAPRTAPRLRPGVAVTPLRGGLHLRGRAGSVTLEGSAALPALWQWLERPLREGRLEDLLDTAEAGPALRAAVETLLGQLDAHGLLVAEPAGQAAADPAYDLTRGLHPPVLTDRGLDAALSAV